MAFLRFRVNLVRQTRIAEFSGIFPDQCFLAYLLLQIWRKTRSTVNYQMNRRARASTSRATRSGSTYHVVCPALQSLDGPQTPARAFSVKRLRRSPPAGGVISWMNMNDCGCVRGHAADFIEHFCDGGASSRQVARQQVVHNKQVSVGRKAPRCCQ